MSVKFVDIDDGLLTIRIVGKLQYADLENFHKAAAKEISHLGTVRVLVLAEDFEGWDKEGQWGDVSFQESFDKNIERMAIVAQERWQDLISLFTGKGLRPFPIECFTPDHVQTAREWLAVGK